MQKEGWSFETPKGSAILGDGPFRVRGMVYTGYVEYVNKRFPVGMAAMLQQAGDPALEAFFARTIFLATASYDIAPLVPLVRTAVALEKMPTDRFVRSRARTAAERDVTGLYRAQMKSSSAVEMAGRLPRIFERYFEGCRSEVLSRKESRLEARFSGLPAPMIGFYVWSNEGFMEGALSAVNARDIRATWSQPSPDGERNGIALQALSIRISWSNR